MNTMKKMFSLITQSVVGQRRTMRGKQGKQKIKGGRFARQLHRQWARAPKTYVPGQNGLSAVSDANRKDHGVIMSRGERKLVARRTGKPLQRYYNGRTEFREQKKGAR